MRKYRLYKPNKTGKLVSYENVRFSGYQFLCCIIDNMDFTNCVLHDVEYRACRFKNVRFYGVDFEDCYFNGCVFEDCEFYYCTFDSGCDFENNSKLLTSVVIGNTNIPVMQPLYGDRANAIQIGD